MSQLLGFKCDQCGKTHQPSGGPDRASKLVSLKLPAQEGRFRDEQEFCNLECMLNSLHEQPIALYKSVEICREAILHVLCRVRDDERVAHLLGCGTQSYALLTEAHAKLCNQSVDETREYFIPGSASIHRKRT